MRIPEISYVAMGVVARFPVAIPAAAMVLAAAVPLRLLRGIITPDTAILIALGAVLIGVIARLGVEIVILVADTLMPR